MGRIIGFLTKPRVDRRQYWTAMPVVALMFAGAWFLVGWSYGRHEDLWLLSLVSLIALFVLGFWIMLRRMTDAGSKMLWLVGLSLGGRLAQWTVRWTGGSEGHVDAALALFFVIAFVALGCAPGKRSPAQDTNVEAEVGARL